MTFKINKFEFLLAFLLGAYFSYFLLAFVTDIRIDHIRPFLTEQAVREGIKVGVEEYKREYVKDEGIRVKRRQIRDRLLEEYTKTLTDRLNKIVEVTK